MDTLAQRLWPKIVKRPAGCWEWTGARRSNGYGHLSRGRRGAGNIQAHRAAWELTHGPIADGLCVLHRCDNPPCCNPDHLFLGTLRDNTQDMLAKGRHRVLEGSEHPSARLTDQDVAHLRRLAPSVGNYAELGRRFGITKQHARALALGQKRKHACA